jgi:hypothetical protein
MPPTAGSTKAHTRSRQVAGSESTRTNRHQRAAPRARWVGGGRYGSGMSTPDHFHASRRFRLARPRTAAAATGTRRIPNPGTMRASDTVIKNARTIPRS